MLAERIDSWNEKVREEGRQLGLEQARKEGLREGMAEVLLLVLETRFGPVDQATRDRIAAADEQHLTEWVKRFATVARPSNVAASLADVLD